MYKCVCIYEARICADVALVRNCGSSPPGSRGAGRAITAPEHEGPGGRTGRGRPGCQTGRRDPSRSDGARRGASTARVAARPYPGDRRESGSAPEWRSSTAGGTRRCPRRELHGVPRSDGGVGRRGRGVRHGRPPLRLRSWRRLRGDGRRPRGRVGGRARDSLCSPRGRGVPRNMRDLPVGRRGDHVRWRGGELAAGADRAGDGRPRS